MTSQTKLAHAHDPQLQSIRLSALGLQLQALTTQGTVIQKLYAEHNEGIDLGINPEINEILRQAKNLCRKTRDIVKRARNGESAAVGRLLSQINDITDRMERGAGDFRGHSEVDAQDHLRDHTGSDPAASVGQIAESLASSSDEIVQASLQCYTAEINQYETFSLQVRSLCSLAKEIAHNAAALAD